MSIVYTGSFFHLFQHDEQFDAAKRVIQLLKPEKGAMIVGRQVGNVNAGEYTDEGYTGGRGQGRHNPKTWTDFWDKVGEATGTKWKVDAEMDAFEVGFGKATEAKLTEWRTEGGAMRMRFVITRV